MRPQDSNDPLRDTTAAVNREQMDEEQAQDVADDALHGLPGDDTGDDVLASHKQHGGIGSNDDDYQDTVDHLKQMVSSGRIDMGAYDGEPMMDDGDTVLSDLESPDGMENRGDDNIGGREDDAGVLENIADTGDDPLASMASDHGDDDETEDDDADPDDIDEDEFPGGIVLGEDGYDAVHGRDDGEDGDR